MAINSTNRAYSDQAEAISVSRDQYQNEIPSDRPMHENTTPGKGSFAWGEGHYSDDFQGGFSSYGVSVGGGGKSSSEVSVNVSKADRGKES